MNIKSMDLAWITVKDAKKSVEFFTKILGLTISSGAEEYAWYELQGKDGGAMLGVGQWCDKSPQLPSKNAVMTMTVDDIVVAKSHLEKHGVQLVGDIMEVPGHVKMQMFSDLDGNLFQLVQKLN